MKDKGAQPLISVAERYDEEVGSNVTLIRRLLIGVKKALGAGEQCVAFLFLFVVLTDHEGKLLFKVALTHFFA